MPGPALHAGGIGLEAGDVVVGGVADKLGDPLDVVFNGAWDVAERLFQGLAMGATYVGAVEGAGAGVKAGGGDDDGKIALGVAGFDAGLGNALDWGFADIDEFDIGLVVGFEIVGFHWHAARAEAVALGDELSRDNLVFNPAAGFGDNAGADGHVGLAIG
jgi:hypothetical protein